VDDARITDLEIRLSHQEAALEELTDTVLAQQRALHALRTELEYLRSLLREAAPGIVGPAADEPPPPHY